MVCVRLPRLGTRLELYSAQFGPPARTSVLAGCILRRYAWSYGELSVLFVEGASVAVHCRYPLSPVEQQALPAIVFACRATDPAHTTVYCDDTGWTHAFRTCPRGQIEALHDAVRGNRPLPSLRESLALRVN